MIDLSEVEGQFATMAHNQNTAGIFYLFGWASSELGKACVISLDDVNFLDSMFGRALDAVGIHPMDGMGIWP
jgi:hypothetical protein